MDGSWDTSVEVEEAEVFDYVAGGDTVAGAAGMLRELEGGKAVELGGEKALELAGGKAFWRVAVVVGLKD